MGTFLQDLRFAIRTLARAPGFLLTSVVTIALGVGATTAIFTVVDRIVLRPLPFPDSERTVVACETSPRTADFCVASPANVADWGRSVMALESIGVARGESVSIVRDGRLASVPGGIASPGFFAALGVQAAAGRLIADDDLPPEKNHVVVISDRFWREQLNSDPAAIGHSITMNGRNVEIIGRLPPDVYIPSFDFAQIWKPLTASVDDTSNRNWRGFLAVGRLARGVSLAEARTQLDVVRARLAQAYPKENDSWGLRVLSLREHVVGSASATLWFFLGAVGLVLIIACANVASLLLVRGSTRGPELALRISLGAGRARLIRQLLTEALVIASIGGTAGWLFALTATHALIQLAPPGIPRLDEVGMDGRVAAFAVALTVTTAIVCGLAPAWLATGRARIAIDLFSTRLTAGGATRSRSALIVGELALSVLLLITAGVLTRSFARILAWSPGFDPTAVSVSWMLVPPTASTTTMSAVPRLEHALDEVATMPGVLAAGLGSGGPLFGGTETGAVAISNAAATPGDAAPVANWYDVDPNYFAALGRRIVQGRDLTSTDVEGAPPVAIVNESFVKRFLRDVSPIGRRVTVHDHAADVVGVVLDARPLRPDVAIPPEIFWPIRQYPRLGAYLVLRTASGISVQDRAIRARVESVDAAISIGTFSRLDQKFRIELLSPRFNMLILLAFALVALTLAAVGVFGVVAHVVATRTREIGIRLALGATPRSMVRAIVLRVMMLSASGLGLGVIVALGLGRLLRGFAYGVTVTDPVVLLTAIGVVLVVTLMAAYLPALGASRVDPMTALRSS